tara:strand:+ start:277 stop:468 length:192 start_codon:yes stop_codon:yes gene_type:complete
MSGPRITEELAEALHRLVDADGELRAAACGGDKFTRKAERFDQAAEKVASVARLIGFSARAAG